MAEIFEIGSRVTAKFFDGEIEKDVEENGTIVEWWGSDYSYSKVLVALDNSDRLVISLSKLSLIR